MRPWWLDNLAMTLIYLTTLFVAYWRADVARRDCDPILSTVWFGVGIAATMALLMGVIY